GGVPGAARRGGAAGTGGAVDGDPVADGPGGGPSPGGTGRKAAPNVGHGRPSPRLHLKQRGGGPCARLFAARGGPAGPAIVRRLPRRPVVSPPPTGCGRYVFLEGGAAGTQQGAPGRPDAAGDLRGHA